jgi:hypothetical protein
MSAESLRPTRLLTGVAAVSYREEDCTVNTSPQDGAYLSCNAVLSLIPYDV